MRWVIEMETKNISARESLLSAAKPSRAIIGLAVPATLALLAKAVYNIVDTAYIGMLGSDIALAAVGVTLPLLLIMVSVENIFAAGAAVLAGRQLGANDREGASRTVTTVVGLSMAIGVGATYIAMVVLRMVLDPIITGKSIGLPPLITLLASVAGLILFGGVGAIVGPAVAAVANIVYRALRRGKPAAKPAGAAAPPAEPDAADPGGEQP